MVGITFSVMQVTVRESMWSVAGQRHCDFSTLSRMFVMSRFSAEWQRGHCVDNWCYQMCCDVFSLHLCLFFILYQGRFEAFAKTSITSLKTLTMSRMLQSIYYVGKTKRVTVRFYFSPNLRYSNATCAPSCSPSPLLRGGTSLQPLPHPQCGVTVSWRGVCRCQRVLQVTLQRHPQRGHTLCLCRSETSTNRMRMHPNYCIHHSPEHKQWWRENSDPLLR